MSTWPAVSSPCSARLNFLSTVDRLNCCSIHRDGGWKERRKWRIVTPLSTKPELTTPPHDPSTSVWKTSTISISPPSKDLSSTIDKALLNDSKLTKNILTKQSRNLSTTVPLPQTLTLSRIDLKFLGGLRRSNCELEVSISNGRRDVTEKLHS